MGFIGYCRLSLLAWFTFWVWFVGFGFVEFVCVYRVMRVNISEFLFVVCFTARSVAAWLIPLGSFFLCDSFYKIVTR